VSATAVLSGSAGGARRSRYGVPFAAAVLVIALIASLAIGPVLISPDKVLAILLDAIFGARPTEGRALRDAIVILDLRLPRTVLAGMVGAALAVAGALLQGIFRNPLADPVLVGVSPGAALAAVTWIVLGTSLAAMWPDWTGRFGVAFAAFAGGLLTTLILHRVATRDGRTSVATLLFAGIALGAIANAGTGLVIFLSTDQQLREFTFWTLGSLGGATWIKAAGAAPFVAALLATSLALARGLDALALGEAEAFHVGINVERLKRFAIVAVAAGVGAAVAVAGVVAFIGLVVPHLLRIATGPSHRNLMVGSALLGAALVVGADTLARTLVSPAELPLGIVTAAIGAPYFLFLLNRYRSSLGG
jgi:iron complex transport system permease protein